MAKKTEKTQVINNVGETLNTEGVIKAMAEASKSTERPISQVDAQNAINLLKQVISGALATGQKVQLTGFLTFAPSYRDARKGNNVSTNEPMDIPASVVVSVKAGKAIKDVMKDLKPEIVNSVKKAQNK